MVITKTDLPQARRRVKRYQSVQGPGHRTGVGLRHVDQENRIQQEGIMTQIAECLAVFKTKR